MRKIIIGSALLGVINSYAVLGPIPITLETEYRTDNPVIGSIASTIRLNSDDIARSGARTFLELLQTIPEVNVFNPPGNVPSVFIRGAQSHNTLLLVDGVRVMDNSTPEGAPNLSVIPLEQIDSIEIVKGAYSSLYGSNAIGGVIQVFTKKDTTGGNLKFSYGTHDTKQGQISYGFKEDKFSLRLSASDYSTDGISVHQNDLSGDKDGNERQSQSIYANYRFSDEVDISFNLLANDTEIEYDNSFGEPTSIGHDLLLKTDFEQRSININYQPTTNWQTKLLLSKNSQKRETFSAINIDSEEYTWLSDIYLNNSLLTIGYAYFKDSIEDSDIVNEDIFAQYQIKLNANNDILLGFRHIDHDRFGNYNTYNLGWGLQLSDKLKFTASYATAFKAPVFDQIFDQIFDTGSSIFRIIGNPNLKPETSKNIEIGLDYRTQLADFFINIYNNKITDDIDFINVPSPTNYINSNDDLISKGIELKVSFRPLAGYNITFSHNYNSAEFENSNTQELRRPKNTTNLIVNKQYKKFDYHLQVIKKSSSLDVGNTRLGGYSLVNAATKYNYNDDIAINFSINNLFKKNYTIASGYNQPGRVINLGVNYQF